MPDSAHLPVPPAVRVCGARVRLGRAAVFDGLDFSAEAGRFTGILGPSGVGKTTLLRLIAGLIPADGTSVGDERGGSLSGCIAWMAQKDLLLPWLTVAENVRLGARLRGETAGREKARALLAAVGLADRADDRPDTLSGGQRQRVALARTLMEDRPVVLMDEPFSAVDPLTRLGLQNLAARMLGGRTVIFVTHDPLEALRLGHAVLVLNGTPATARPIALPALATWPRAADDPAVLAAHAEILRALAPEAAR
ncbi:Aliphatic sulfonates import ATP-binding protein SsuB 1 [uncultured Alphaproteobacteria bacterium]|uniref:Aliphatic sulfonates import ATP-binding protein SsuB 1 n=1 Tax=uncultured Alphaproteobacteria bacterium TaxID=91750 RepID=A0A212IXY6_9PROT|nr:Aliphatic sulfonates import ATP-binding protein SsuB 1 [uncultured Alphaproteobacteria bacterium]